MLITKIYLKDSKEFSLSEVRLKKFIVARSQDTADLIVREIKRGKHKEYQKFLKSSPFQCREIIKRMAPARQVMYGVFEVTFGDH